jgi:hypothetical protein
MLLLLLLLRVLPLGVAQVLLQVGLLPLLCRKFDCWQQ